MIQQEIFKNIELFRSFAHRSNSVKRREVAGSSTETQNMLRPKVLNNATSGASQSNRDQKFEMSVNQRGIDLETSSQRVSKRRYQNTTFSLKYKVKYNSYFITFHNFII